MQAKIMNVYDNPNKAVRDAYDMLTASIHVLNNQEKNKTFAFTSCNPHEGKTTMAISLSVAMARAGWKVLLIDADMRKSNEEKRLNEDSRFGLSDYLAGDIEFDEALSETNISNLMYLSSGSDCEYPVELLCSARFEELVGIINKLYYDFVIFDTPAIEAAVDGTIIASKVDATLLVAEMGYTSLRSLKYAQEQLVNFNAKILGVVLNNVNKRDYKRYLGSYDYFIDSDVDVKVNKGRLWHRIQKNIIDWSMMARRRIWPDNNKAGL